MTRPLPKGQGKVLLQLQIRNHLALVASRFGVLFLEARSRPSFEVAATAGLGDLHKAFPALVHCLLHTIENPRLDRVALLSLPFRTRSLNLWGQLERKSVCDQIAMRGYFAGWRTHALVTVARKSPP